MITAKEAHAQANWANRYELIQEASEALVDILKQIDRDSNEGAFLTECPLLPGYIPTITRYLLDLGFSVEKEPISKWSTLLRISWEGITS